MTVTTADGITRIADLVDGYWGLRLRHKELAHAGEWYRVLVYDAFTVRLSIMGDAVRIEVHATAPQPAELEPLEIAHDLVPSALLRLDEEFRSRLPAAYLSRFDEWAATQERLLAETSGRLSPQQRRALLVDESQPAVAGPVIGCEAVPDLLFDHFGDLVKVAAPGDSRVEAVLDGVLPFTIVCDGQHGVITGGVWLGEQAVGSLFEERLIARHPDARSVIEMVDVIDRWLNLRRGV